MWYEALPSLFLTGAFVFGPMALVPVVHKFFQQGNAYSRLQNNNEERHCVRRDNRLGNGDEYKIKLLESIPD